MTLASAIGLAAVLVIRAEASAPVVVGTHRAGTALTRLKDAVVGAAIALDTALGSISQPVTNRQRLRGTIAEWSAIKHKVAMAS